MTTDAYPGRIFRREVSSFNSKVDSTQPHASGAGDHSERGRGAAAGDVRERFRRFGGIEALVTIPLAAVAFNPYGSLVYVLHDEKDDQGHEQHVVVQQFVTTGDRAAIR